MNHKQPEEFSPGIGATTDLNLRVSVAALVRVLFTNPADGKSMLALERRAALHETNAERLVAVKSQPFGGALRIHDPGSLQTLIGDFHFDGEQSRLEQDFRIFIRPSAWGTVKEFCLGHLNQPNDLVLEGDPARELKEEFADTLGIELKRDQYTSQAIGTIVEDHPSATENVHARGYDTARIYRIFEVRITDPSLASVMIRNSERCSDHDLRELVLQKSRSGGSGRANGVLTLPFQEITTTYSAILPEERNSPVSFQSHLLDETVAAVLDNLTVPKYRRL